MYHVKTMNKISKIGLAQLDDRFEISDTMEHEDAILVRSAKLHDYDFPAELLCIARAGAGVNNIPLDRAADAGIVVFNTPGANANGVKELKFLRASPGSRSSPLPVRTSPPSSRRASPPTSALRSWARRWAWSAWVPSACWWPTPPLRWA